MLLWGDSHDLVCLLQICIKAAVGLESWIGLGPKSLLDQLSEYFQQVPSMDVQLLKITAPIYTLTLPR